MAADAGAQQIYDLLHEPSQRLQDDALAFAKATKKASSKPYGVTPQYGIDALADMRQYYRDLRAQIAAIDTVDTASKSTALDALDALDRHFGAHERGLDFGFSKPAIPRLKKSAKIGGQAVAGLKKASRGLSQ